MDVFPQFRMIRGALQVLQVLFAIDVSSNGLLP